MKIHFVSFLNPTEYFGGGEMITREILRAGAQRGHDIILSSQRPFCRAKLESVDLTILCDIQNTGSSWRSLGANRAFPQSWLDEIMEGKPFINFQNAYVDVCSVPYLPCKGLEPDIRSVCSYKKRRGALKNSLLYREASYLCSSMSESRKKLFTNSLLNVFLSPLHESVHRNLLPDICHKPSYILAPLIDTSRFYNRNIERDIKYLFCGVISDAKGFSELEKLPYRDEIVFVGKNTVGKRMNFGTHMGHVPYEQIPMLMNRSQNFIFLPSWPEPQGRVVIEAALCGCNIISNENSGALSFKDSPADPSWFLNESDRFWDTIEKLDVA